MSIETSATTCWPIRSATIDTVMAPTGTSVTAAWTGWPSHVPLRNDCIGRIGWNSTLNQRWLKSPNGFDQRAWASTARFTYRPSIAHHLLDRVYGGRRAGGSFGRYILNRDGIRAPRAHGHQGARPRPPPATTPPPRPRPAARGCRL